MSQRKLLKLGSLLAAINPAEQLWCTAKPRFQSNLSLATQTQRIPPLKAEPNIRIASVKWDKNEISLKSHDGHHYDMSCISLRDACKCKACYDRVNLFRRIPHPLSTNDATPLEVSVAENGTKIKVQWLENQMNKHESEFDSNWIHANLAGSRKRPVKTLWNAETLKEIPASQYNDYLSSEEELIRFLKMFREFGFALIRNVPSEEGNIQRVAQRLGHIRETHFGVIDEIVTGPDAWFHPAYKKDSLPLHTDSPHMERAPSITVCNFYKTADPKSVGVENAGGETQWTDGFYAAERLRQEDPECFDILTRVRVPFSFGHAKNGRIYNSKAPIIELEPETGELRKITWHQNSRQPMFTTGHSDIKIEDFYKAIKKFGDLLVANTLHYFAETGDLAILNNTRVLHGRGPFREAPTERHLRVCFLDLDEVEALYDLKVPAPEE